MATNGQISSWNLPNALTTLRILLVPFFIWMLWDSGTFGGDSMPARWVAVAIFAVAMYTDKLDGDIARSRGIVTNFGKIADPIADKFLTGAAWITMSLLGEIWWWITIVILLREWGITLMRIAMLRTRVMPASRGGKIKTVLQTAAILILLLPLSTFVGTWWLWLGWVLVLAAMAVTLVTGVDYVIKAIRAPKEEPTLDE
ncbi:MAG TPA: CDP-diacylglycerol--glycerol-3-phosphate 3-phosphatidyltransferase [Enteractinococcus helveticum]|uniref:CDP-diacylglycerol--glycerol-3-phosphate 3-phosphatidyltransferase n=1 Tax=Enteractinococcus helveticum TaxID=1837282 RepID=A0A921K8R8_9MICC|nr:CDP-diacylglycerol--glycerol-3-phosphate 3-phosphatidyltransferase [Enteractinococcus helveticum]HJF15561.1 CDP-diacylglycerol--glycerol-3-phosphate 3-phosphatidyltransferase [Enteractinococcus helveticum]